MNKLLILVLVLATTVFANKKYCTKETDKQRSTLIYLDVSDTSQKEFATDLLKEIDNNFLAHERIKVFTINPEEVTIKEVFSSCVPKLSLSEIKKIKAEGSMKYLLGGNPIETAKEDYSFFMAELKGILAKIYKSSLDDVSKKELVEMLYSESATFNDKSMQRVIFYSNMVQNSDFLNTATIFNNQVTKDLLKEYQVDFNNAEFYIYTGKKQFTIKKHNALMNFWKKYVEQNNGTVVYFNDNLKLDKFKYQVAKKYEGTLEIDGDSYESKIYLNYSENSKAVNSWLIVNEIASIPVKGTVKLVSGKPFEAKLKTNVVDRSNHQLFIGGETIQLKIKGSKLVGEVKMDNTVVQLNGKEIKDPIYIVKMNEVK